MHFDKCINFALCTRVYIPCRLYGRRYAVSECPLVYSIDLFRLYTIVNLTFIREAALRSRALQIYSNLLIIIIGQ